MSAQFEKDWRLFLAARDGDLSAGRAALNDGADPNFVEPPKRRQSIKPSSTLLRAVDYGHADFAEMLLDAGASLPTTKDEQARLSSAARRRDPATLMMLLRRGLPANQDDADWAQEQGHRELQDFVEQALGKFAIKYDIDDLLSMPYNKFYYDFCQAVPDYCSIHDALLFPQERVIRDLWELCCDMGSGFSSLISNEHYDTVARGYWALCQIRPSNALRAVSELRDALCRHGFPLEPDKALDYQGTLSDAARQALDNDIAALDSRFFSGSHGDSLWRNNDYLDYGMEYAREHIETLRKRKQG